MVNYVIEEDLKTARRKEFFSWVRLIVFAIAMALAMRAFIFEFVRVEQSSMYPTLHDQDKVLVLKVSYRFGVPSRGDIAIIKISEDKNYVKRVIGLPGETIKVEDSLVYINGELLDEAYLPDDLPSYPNFKEMQIPEGAYFVMGDNRPTSIDSRDSSVGLIQEDRFIGRVVFRLSPFTWFSAK